MIRRVERLERAISRPTEEVPPMEIENVFIAPDGEVVGSLIFTIPPPDYIPWRQRNAKLPAWKREGAVGR